MDSTSDEDRRALSTIVCEYSRSIRNRICGSSSPSAEQNLGTAHAPKPGGLGFGFLLRRHTSGCPMAGICRGR